MPRFRPGYRPNRRSLIKSGAAALAGLTFLPRFSLAEEEKKLNLYNWDTYIGESTLTDFTNATGVEVKLDLYADNDELFAKLKGGNPGYDVIVPTNDTLERMIKADMVIPIDHAKIPNMTNIDEPFKDASFDPGRKYSIPYMWGTLGIGYRKSAVNGTPDSWKVLYDSNEYAGAISLLGDQQNVLGGGLKYLGYSWNSTNPDELKKVEELLIKQKKNIKVFANDNGQDLLAAGEVKLCQEWNGDIKQIIAEDDDVDYIVPQEGSLLWQDTLAIPKGAPHPENAHAFMNFVLDAEAGKEIVETIMYATANKAAKELMPEDYRNNPVVFPPAEIIAKCEPGLYLGEEATKLRDEIWTRIRAS
ncbi:PotD/PotF family extracellular solute-binding protein [Aestuariivirga sp.]|jgi:spermidine/putrescine transport system substrate-binding protein|uniref:PotD/PotF family extracellular solute-binding protein n=1 Tax=Aestuariivirga sp. TaxID=2650926 RepID=UPI0037837BC3